MNDMTFEETWEKYIKNSSCNIDQMRFIWNAALDSVPTNSEEFWITLFLDEDTNRPYILGNFYPNKKTADFSASLCNDRVFIKSVKVFGR